MALSCAPLIMSVLTTYLMTLSFATLRSNNNAEMLKALRERPGSVLIIHSPKHAINSTFAANNTSADNTTVSTPAKISVRAIRFDGEWIHRYVEVGKNFVRDEESPQFYTKTKEQIPANVTAAVTGPDGDVYFFSNDRFCKRSFNYRGPIKYCPLWENNLKLFGCLNESNSSQTNQTDQSYSNETKTIELCSNATIDGITSSKSDKTSRIKYVYQGKARWILTINSPDGRSGYVVRDHKYEPRLANETAGRTNWQASDANDVNLSAARLRNESYMALMANRTFQDSNNRTHHFYRYLISNSTQYQYENTTFNATAYDGSNGTSFGQFFGKLAGKFAVNLQLDMKLKANLNDSNNNATESNATQTNKSAIKTKSSSHSSNAKKPFKPSHAKTRSTTQSTTQSTTESATESTTESTTPSNDTIAVSTLSDQQSSDGPYVNESTTLAANVTIESTETTEATTETTTETTVTTEAGVTAPTTATKKAKHTAASRTPKASTTPKHSKSTQRRNG